MSLSRASEEKFIGVRERPSHAVGLSGTDQERVRERRMVAPLPSGSWNENAEKLEHHLVEPRGLEPLTPCLQSRCATNCAKAP